MSLNRQEKKDLVLDLYKKGKSYLEIAEYARISFRDIKTIVNKEALSAETKAEQLHPSLTEVAAYKLFSEGKDPVEVAIELNLIHQDVTLFQRGFWKLKQLHRLNQVYEHTNGNLLPFLELYELAKKMV
jgi:DNA-binding CsgD family transcriptional regulator